MHSTLPPNLITSDVGRTPSGPPGTVNGFRDAQARFACSNETSYAFQGVAIAVSTYIARPDRAFDLTIRKVVLP